MLKYEKKNHDFEIHSNFEICSISGVCFNLKFVPIEIHFDLKVFMI
jgi:hypothetical protein